MTLILLFVLLVWLKIVVGSTLIFLWLWVVRDRDVHGVPAALNTICVFVFWLAPWVAFMVHEAGLYTGRCGLRQGVRDCGLAEFLWSRASWVELGFLLDLAIFVGILVLMARARVARGRSRPVQAPVAR